MSDSFFGFNTTLDQDTALDDGVASDEDDGDYDALNDETFGEDVLSGDWEEDHEKLVTQLSRRGGSRDTFFQVFRNGDLDEKLASFFLDDDSSLQRKYESIENVKAKPRPPPGFTPNNAQPDVRLTPELSLSAISTELRLSTPQPILPLKNVCTVEELERNLIKPPATSLRLEDLERNLIQPNPSGLPLNFRHFQNITPIPPPRPSPSPLVGSILKMPPFPPFHPMQQQQQQQHPRLLPPGFPGMRLPFAKGPTPHPILGRIPPTFPHVPQNNVPVFPQRSLPPEDEYAGLMTTQEKQWLLTIQVVQLSTNSPFQDDYYFIMYQQRFGHRKVGCPIKRDPNLTKPSYTPLQFENSLGKLQVGSVTAPRKLIDNDIVENIECSTSSSSSKKVKQVLLEIEHMFTDMLVAEEALSPYATAATAEVDAYRLINKVVNILLKDDKLKTVLSIRKGKNLVLRVLSHHEVANPLAQKLITVLPLAAKRDSESMLRALPAIRHFLASASLETLVQLSRCITGDIENLLSNKFGISVIANMIERAEACMSSTNTESQEWIDFLCHLLASGPSELEKPVVGVSGPVLSRHLSRCVTANNQHVAILHKALSNSVN